MDTGTLNLFTPKGKGRTIGLWLRMSTLVIRLAAVVMVVALAIFAPANVVAADSAVVAKNVKTMSTHCSDILAETELARNYGTYTSCWHDLLDRIVSANPELEIGRNSSAAVVNPSQTELRRTYGSSAVPSVRAGQVDREVTPNSGPMWIGRTYGSSAVPGVRASQVDRELTPSSDPLWMGRTYGYD